MNHKDLKSSILFHLDTGGHIDAIKKLVINYSFDKESVDKEFDELLASKVLTMGNISRYVVVTDDMPRTAEKLANEK